MLAVHIIWLPTPLLIWLGFAYFFCAGLVSRDVLLKKSDVRGALGWIAVAWLSPFFGPALYYLFGINRVERRAVRFRHLDRGEIPDGSSTLPPDLAAHIAGLAEIGKRVTRNPLTAGNRLRIFEEGEAAYGAMLAAISAAKSTVALLSYIFRDDCVGRDFVAALIAARQRGVEVRVQIDSIGSGYLWSGVQRQLAAAGVPVARFLHTWIPWRMPFLNMRNHRKLLIVDGALAFTGGMNIGAEYACKEGLDRVNDIHFQVEGPVVRQLMEAFARDWSFTTEEVLDADGWWPALEPAGNSFARGVSSGPDADLYKIEALLGAALTQAEQRVRIVTPYFLPDQRLQFAIAQAVLRGVHVDILIPQRSDQRLMDWAMRAQLRFLRHIKAHYYLTSEPFDHAKLITVDGTWAMVGSSNWDTRSFRLNFEFDLECYDRDFTLRLDRLIDRRIAQGRKLAPQDLDRPTPLLLRDAAARLFLPYL